MNAWQQLDPASLAARLSEAMARGLPGHTAQRSMAHGLAYGRHRGPVPDDARRAAVLLALDPTANGWSIPAVLRPATMRDHASQVSLPGGSIESDETAAQAALREYEEELGPPPAELQVIGHLTPVYVFVSGFEVTPVVAISPRPLVFQPNPHEVAAIIELPLADLCDPANRGHHLIDRRGLRFQVPHFAIAGQQVWGATSLILAEFVALLSAGTKPGSGEAPMRSELAQPHSLPTGSTFAPG
jgi:8-oxo-dGTP pyrophosphatase MutT (NUDIX family)